jgi:hypothetical protein
MLTNSLAPIKRACLFFGFMGIAVATLTFGAGLQSPGDQSSTTVAQVKIERNIPTDAQFAAVNPGERAVTNVKRAIPSSQQARLAVSSDTILR